MTANHDWRTVTCELQGRLLHYGLDLVVPFSTGWYNRRAKHDFQLPEFRNGKTLGILVACTHAFWKPFVKAYLETPSLKADPHPVDTWSEKLIREAAGAQGAAFNCRWPHHRDGHKVAIQLLSEAAGLAKTSPSHLSVHALHGPWIAFRGVVVFDLEGPSVAEGGTPPMPLDTCSGCAAPCLKALETARNGLTGEVSADGGIPNWRDWVAVRDACPLGRASRYTENQIRYHYQKDTDAIRLP